MNRYDINETAQEVKAWKEGINYPNFKPQNNFDELFGKLLTIDITKLDIQSAEQYLLQLTAYSLYVQIEMNKVKSMFTWYENNIKHVVGKELINVPEYVGRFFPAQDAYVRSNNKITQEMDEDKTKYQIKLQLIENIANKIDFICDALKAVIYSKRKTI